MSTTNPTVSYTYDNNGSVLTKSDGTQYTWDYENELTQVVLPSPGGTVNFKYDPFGRRIQKAFTQSGTTTTTDYLYDGVNRIEDIDLNGNLLARYVQGNGIDAPLEEIASGTTSYYQQDGLGSVTSLSSTTGTLGNNTYTYDSYGNTTTSATVANPFRYTGREFDAETGIYYYRARYYDQGVGRFLNEDPIEFGGGINFYPYALNSPVNLRDPRGKSAGAAALPIAEGLGGAICFGSGVCETAIVVGGAVAGLAATGYLILELVKRPPCDNSNNCAPCIPPVGTIAFRIDVVPPSKPHPPYTGTHWHLYRMNQNPNNCQCFWQDLDVAGEGPTPSGTVPIGPAGGGGPQ
jgi:RHS repeat-associated protein